MTDTRRPVGLRETQYRCVPPKGWPFGRAAWVWALPLLFTCGAAIQTVYVLRVSRGYGFWPVFGLLCALILLVCAEVVLATRTSSTVLGDHALTALLGQRLVTIPLTAIDAVELGGTTSLLDGSSRLAKLRVGKRFYGVPAVYGPGTDRVASPHDAHPFLHDLDARRAMAAPSSSGVTARWVAPTRDQLVLLGLYVLATAAAAALWLR